MRPPEQHEGAGLQDRLVAERPGWPAEVVIHDRPAVEEIVENLEYIIASLIETGAIGWACDLGDLRDLFAEALRYPDGVRLTPAKP